jgi:hypothetical protein
VRWRVDETLADLDPDTDEERGFRDLLELADCIDLEPLPEHVAPPVTRTTEEENTLLKKETPPKSFGIDPHRFLNGREHRFLDPLPQLVRIAVCDAILNDMVAYPIPRDVAGRLLTRQAAARAWHRLRDVPIGNTTFGRVIRQPDVSPMALEHTMELLVSLRLKRAELEAQLATLDEIEAAFADGERVAS